MKKLTKVALEKERRQAIKMFNDELKAVRARCAQYIKEHKYLHSSKVREEAEKLDRLARSDDPRMRGSVVIAHEDGSHHFFNYAWFEIVGIGPSEKDYRDFEAGKRSLTDNRWLIVFAEHAGTQVFSIGDLSYYQQNESRTTS